MGLFTATVTHTGWHGQDKYRLPNAAYRALLSKVAEQQAVWYAAQAGRFADEVANGFKTTTDLQRWAFNPASLVDEFRKLVTVEPAAVLLLPKRTLQLSNTTRSRAAAISRPRSFGHREPPTRNSSCSLARTAVDLRQQ